MNCAAKSVVMVAGVLLSGTAVGAPGSGRSRGAAAAAAPPAPSAAVMATDSDPPSAPEATGAEPSAAAPTAAEGAPLQLDAAEDPASEETLDPYARIRDLELRLEQTRSVVNGQRPRVTLNGYIDGGFFVPQGNGAGIVRDNGNTLFPQYAG